MEPPGPLTVKLSSRASWATRAHPATASTASHAEPGRGDGAVSARQHLGSAARRGTRRRRAARSWRTARTRVGLRLEGGVGLGGEHGEEARAERGRSGPRPSRPRGCGEPARPGPARPRPRRRGSRRRPESRWLRTNSGRTTSAISARTTRPRPRATIAARDRRARRTRRARAARPRRRRRAQAPGELDEAAGRHRGGAAQHGVAARVQLSRRGKRFSCMSRVERDPRQDQPVGDAPATADGDPPAQGRIARARAAVGRSASGCARPARRRARRRWRP